MHFSGWNASSHEGLGARDRRDLTEADRLLYRTIRHSLRGRGRLQRRAQFSNCRAERRHVRSNQHLRCAEFALLRVSHGVSTVEISVRDRSGQQGERSCAFFTRGSLAELAAILGRCAIVSAGGLMCTVSFLPKSQGFYLAMNRDEKRVRLAGLAPMVVELEAHRAVFPREPTGGTWISTNDAGVCLALINWHRIGRKPKNGILSRGEVVRELAGKSTVDELAAAVNQLPVRKLRPFRLIAIVPGE